ncbi:MAG: hypothetical protein WA919_23070 [Coleofasciculaceae cyanobacterium]
MINHVSKRALLLNLSTLITLQAIWACILPVGKISVLPTYSGYRFPETFLNVFLRSELQIVMTV